MAASKREKKVRQREQPPGRRIVQKEAPGPYYKMHPAWNFSACDTEQWAFSSDNAGPYFWQEILPRLQSWESQTWDDILLHDKDNSHSIQVGQLNKSAQQRLAEKYIEQEALISLRINGTHRLYGYIERAVFHILWFDPDHGDNDSCVCRSHKRNT